MQRLVGVIAGFLVVVACILPTTAGAQYDPDQGLIPACEGNSCELCHVIALANKIIDFIIIYFSWPVAAVLFAYAGFIYITSQGNPGRTSQAKAIFTNVAIGFVIILAAWLIIDAIMGSLVNQNNLGRPWHEIACVGRTGTGQGGGGGHLVVVPANLACRTPGQNYVDGYDTCDPTARQNIEFAVRNPEGVSLRSSVANAVCSTGWLAPYGANITQALQTAQNPQLNATLVQAVIMKESSGYPDTHVHPRSGAVGRMQVLPTTAQSVIPSLQGQSSAAVTTWLQNPTNNIMAGTAYLDSLLTKYNGNVDLALAAYNGGPVANLTSVNCCVGVSNCTVKRWQCEWDNNAHTVRNTGYQETRNYVPWVTSRQTQISSGQCP